MKIIQNKTGHLNFRNLREGFAEATETLHHTILIGRDTRGYYVKVSNRKGWHQEEHFSTVAEARAHFRFMSDLAGAPRAGMRGM